MEEVVAAEVGEGEAAHETDRAVSIPQQIES
jgi:hypothetical protein